ncbi:putative exocyst complex component Sec8/EXOC4 [Helianthus debilis subsp. tardiflorus]
MQYLTIGGSIYPLSSECQQQICEILRATPEASSVDAAVQTARLANKIPSKDKRDKSEDGRAFAVRFTDATVSSQGVDLIHQG